jgi:hypothetical protein
LTSRARIAYWQEHQEGPAYPPHRRPPSAQTTIDELLGGQLEEGRAA